MAILSGLMLIHDDLVHLLMTAAGRHLTSKVQIETHRSFPLTENAS